MLSAYSFLKKIHDTALWSSLSSNQRILFGILLLRGVSISQLDALNRNHYFFDACNVHPDHVLDRGEIMASAEQLVPLERAHSGVQNPLVEQEILGKIQVEEVTEAAHGLLLQYVRALKELLCEKIGQDRLFPSEHVKNLVSEFNQLGYVVIENFFDKELVDELTNELDTLEESEKTSIGYLYAGGTSQRVYNLVSKSDVFRRLLMDTRYMALLDSIYDRSTLHDKFFLSSLQSNTLYPGSEEQIWHVDNNTPQPLAPWIMRVQTALPLSDFSHNNGATELIPQTHLLNRIPSPSLEPEYLSKVLRVTAPRGSLIVWDGRIWHRATANRSSKKRQALLGCFCSSVIREVGCEEDYAKVMPDYIKRDLPENLRTLLGLNHGVKPGALIDKKTS